MEHIFSGIPSKIESPKHIKLMEEIWRSAVQVDSLSHYLQGFIGFIHPRWLFGISEPSTVSN